MNISHHDAMCSHEDAVNTGIPDAAAGNGIGTGSKGDQPNFTRLIDTGFFTMLVNSGAAITPMCSANA